MSKSLTASYKETMKKGRCSILDSFLEGAGITAKAEQLVLEPAATTESSHQRARFLVSLGHAFSQDDELASEKELTARRFWLHNWDTQAALTAGMVFKILEKPAVALHVAAALCDDVFLSERIPHSPSDV